MPVRVDVLKLKVKLRGHDHKEVLHAEKGAKAPVLVYASPRDPSASGELAREDGLAASQKAAEEVEVASKPNPQLVADRVYDIMLQENRFAKMRGGV